MKPPVEAPTSSAVSPVGIDLEGVEGGRELVPAAADVRLRAGDLDRGRGIERVAGFVVEARRVAVPDPHLAGEHERLRAAARLDQAALDEQLIEPHAPGPGVGSGDGVRGHVRIVAQPALPGLNGGSRPLEPRRSPRMRRRDSQGREFGAFRRASATSPRPR